MNYNCFILFLITEFITALIIYIYNEIIQLNHLFESVDSDSNKKTAEITNP